MRRAILPQTPSLGNKNQRLLYPKPVPSTSLTVRSDLYPATHQSKTGSFIPNLNPPRTTASSAHIFSPWQPQSSSTNFSYQPQAIQDPVVHQRPPWVPLQPSRHMPPQRPFSQPIFKTADMYQRDSFRPNQGMFLFYPNPIPSSGLTVRSDLYPPVNNISYSLPQLQTSYPYPSYPPQAHLSPFTIQQPPVFQPQPFWYMTPQSPNPQTTYGRQHMSQLTQHDAFAHSTFAPT